MPPDLRPDPARGVFETLLVVDGRPLELDAHAERLGGSLAALYRSARPLDARRLLLDRAAGLRLARLRLTAAPLAGERLGAELAAERLDPGLLFPGPERGAELRSLAVEGGLGAHKWADRRLLERAEARGPAGALPLLLDGDGAVLEASRANLFAVRDGVLLTPPADGRIVAGIARRRLLELAREEGCEAREERLSLDDLHAADEVLLTGSVRGVERAAAVDGVALGAGGDVGAELAAALRRRWLGQRQALKLA